MKRAALGLALGLALAACGHRAPPHEPELAPPPAAPPPAADSTDLVLVVDLSKSMMETDLPPDRLGATQIALHGFLADVRGRVGLVIFGQEAQVRAPISDDRAALDDLISGLAIGDVPELGTAIGDALGLAVSELAASPSCKAVVLLADGDNNVVETYTPEQATALAKDAGVTVHTILVGSEDASTNPKVLEDIAAATGGTSWRAANAGALDLALDEIRAAIRAGC